MSAISKNETRLQYKRKSFILHTRCSSTLGYTGRLQHINLGKNCYAHRTLLHEIGHTLGLIHEHQHPLRDTYVTVSY